MLNYSEATKQGLIVYAGKPSTDYGIVVSEAPAFDKPRRKTTVFNVPGRSGSIVVQEDAWEDTVRSYHVWLTKDAKKDLTASVNAISEWLYSASGYQRLEDSFEPDTFRLAYYNGGQEFATRLMQAGEATISFTCRPERFYKNAYDEAIDITSGITIINPTPFKAKPIIIIVTSGTQTVDLYVHGHHMTAEVTNVLYIDSDTMNAYDYLNNNMNANVSGEFPVLDPGSNGITISGSVNMVQLVPRFYTI
jgi:phage-related protein